MATENVGGIQYTVDADTAAMLKAEAVVNKSISNQVKYFNKADQAVRDYISTQKDLGNTVNSTGQVIDKNGAIVADATKKYRQLATDAQSSFERTSAAANQTTTRMTKHAAAVKMAGNQSGRSSFQMSNMSYQLQDIAVQTQMGTNAFIVMSQQLPQMMTGMGGLAAAIGAVIAVGGLLATTLIDTTQDSTKFNQAIERTKAVMTLSTGGIVEYTQKMEDLGRISQAVAQYQIKNAMNDAKEGVKLAVKQMADDISSVDDTVLGVQFGFAIENQAILGTNAMRDYTVKIGNFLGVAGDASNKSGDEAQKAGEKFIKLFASINQAKTPKEITNIQEELIKMASANGIADKKFREMFNSLMSAKDGTEDYFTKLRQLTAVLEEGAKGQTDFSNNTSKSKSAIADMTNELLTQIVELKSGAREAYKYQLQLQGLNEDQKASMLTLYDKRQALIAEKEATEDATEANKNYDKSVRDKTASDLDWYEQQLAKQNKKDTQSTAALTTQVQSIGLTPEQEIQARYDAEIELLRQAEEKKIEIEGTYAERRTQLEKERLESVKALQSESNEFLEAAFGNLDTQIAGTMASVVLGAQDGEDALRSLATTILTQVVGAIIQQGIASVFASQTAAKGQTVANAEILATAAPAASAVSLATAGANSFPAVAGIAAVSAAMAGISSIAGAREFGGPVTAGKSYLVGERGPEMFTPGTSGGIVSNSDMSGSSGVSVNINNYSGQEVTQNYDEVKKIVTVEIGKQISGIRKGTGQMAKALKGTTTNKNRATKV